MNLIEQLGGYEKAKEWYAKETKRLSAKGLWSWKFSELQIEMLQYRRENNIFEVGDKIIDGCIGGNVVSYHSGYDQYKKWVECFVRHATEEEIQAGKRLEVD